MIVYSMIETGKANGIDPLKYLSYLLEHRLDADMRDEELAAFAPWNEDVRKACKNKVE